jgi:hypothetical protein
MYSAQIQARPPTGVFTLDDDFAIRSVIGRAAAVFQSRGRACLRHHWGGSCGPAKQSDAVCSGMCICVVVMLEVSPLTNLQRVAVGRLPLLKIFGNDYPTADGE